MSSRTCGGSAGSASPRIRARPKPTLRWADWDAPFDGLEWLNADSEWRDEFWGSLGRVLLTYAFRPAETLAGLLDRPDVVLQAMGSAGADAPRARDRRRRRARAAGASAGGRDPYEDRVLARVPSYEVSFRAFVNHVILDGPLTGDAATDARPRSGGHSRRAGVHVDRRARRAECVRGEGDERGGDRTARRVPRFRGPVAIEATIAAPAGTTLAVVRDGERIYERRSRRYVSMSARHRARIASKRDLPRPLATASVPWLLTNPIYVGLREHMREGRR